MTVSHGMSLPVLLKSAFGLSALVTLQGISERYDDGQE